MADQLPLQILRLQDLQSAISVKATSLLKAASLVGNLLGQPGPLYASMYRFTLERETRELVELKQQHEQLLGAIIPPTVPEEPGERIIDRHRRSDEFQPQPWISQLPDHLVNAAIFPEITVPKEVEPSIKSLLRLNMFYQNVLSELSILPKGVGKWVKKKLAQTNQLFNCHTHVHVKTQGHYLEIGMVKVQSGRPLNDMDEAVLYVGEDGQFWVRPEVEFRDRGRFETASFHQPPLQV